ncbi:MAG: ATP-binding protein [Pseudomonadota bacterium]
MAKKSARRTTGTNGKLRIGDDWNAITIIALSQSNPLKAVAEFVENSIDAGATQIDIIRGREKGEAYLRIRDNGRGIPKDDEGIPNFKFVATHICDSIKRQLKSAGNGDGMQGEFGIGLLSFWTVGENLLMRSAADDGKPYEMRMAKGDQRYSITPSRSLFDDQGTELTIKPLLKSLQLSGEKIQWYLASELRDRIKQSGVEITVRDRTARKELKVEPRQFEGRLLNGLQGVDNVYLELYLTEPKPGNQIGLYRAGTRVFPSITDLDRFAHAPWTSQYLQGIVDCPNLNLTPGTRLGVIYDDKLNALEQALKQIEPTLIKEIEAQQSAEEEQASQQILKTLNKAFREALITLPAEEYDWFELQRRKPKPRAAEDTHEAPVESAPGQPADNNNHSEATLQAITHDQDDHDPETPQKPQKELFEYVGPLASVRISPASSVVRVTESRALRALARDKQRRQVDREVLFQWRIIEGEGTLENSDTELLTFTAPQEPGLVKIGITATEGDVMFEHEALLTVTSTLVEDNTRSNSKDGTRQHGLPAYSFQKAAGELWRSEFDTDRNLVIINSGHRDFVFASKSSKALKLRYICRLYAKELVIRNFPGARPDELLERMIEITLYAEENLR